MASEYRLIIICQGSALDFLPTHEYFVGVFNSVDPDYKPLGSGVRPKGNTVSQSITDQRNVAWSRPFRVIVCVMALVFFVEPFLVASVSDGAFGGHYRYLTRWNFTLNTVIALWALLSDYRPAIKVPPVVVSVALPMNTTVLLLYWGLYAIDPAL